MLVGHGIGAVRDRAEVETVSDTFSEARLCAPGDAILDHSHRAWWRTTWRAGNWRCCRSIRATRSGRWEPSVTRAETVQSLAAAALMRAVRDIADREREKGLRGRPALAANGSRRSTQRARDEAGEVGRIVVAEIGADRLIVRPGEQQLPKRASSATRRFDNGEPKTRRVPGGRCG